MTARQIGFVAALFIGGLLAPPRASAHCDGMDGPVVQAAARALGSKDIDMALIWVQPKDEAEVRAAFQEALAVRKLGAEAKALADRSFFETLVRLHRSGEGAPYTGLKPSGRDLGPAIPAADKALQSGSPDRLMELLAEEVRHSLETRYKEALERKAFKVSDVRAGREYVRAYVEFIHLAERIRRAAESPTHGHFEDEPRSRAPELEHKD